MDFSRLEYRSGQPFPSSRDLPNPGIEPRSPALQADSLPGELYQVNLPAKQQGKAKNSSLGSLSFLWQIFLTQESNWGLLNCKQILYQLSHKGSPSILEWVAYAFSSRSS